MNRGPTGSRRPPRVWPPSIKLVLKKTRNAHRVNLVAHSMGGLICRSALQRYLPEPATVVSKLFTIGTPHGGIDPELGGAIGDWLIDKFGPSGSDIFQPRRMKEYLLPEGYDGAAETDSKTGRWDPRRMVGTFPVTRVLSVVGTNAKDYDVALGLSAKAMGPQSDGLVAIRNAYVRGSARAYVHRSHSGRYGLVNSEEVYQNLSGSCSAPSGSSSACATSTSSTTATGSGRPMSGSPCGAFPS